MPQIQSQNVYSISNGVFSKFKAFNLQPTAILSYVNLSKLNFGLIFGIQFGLKGP